MKKLYIAAVSYASLGLISGLFYREFTKQYDYEGITQLSVVHTHLLVLGMMVFLLTIALEKLFKLSESKWFNLFFWHYNGGLILTAGMMVVHGILSIQGETGSAMLDGISGIGHIVITVGIVFFFMALYKRLFKKQTS